MRFSVHQNSQQGGRERNEDRMGYCYTRQSCLFMLADGMGGHPEGATAAHLALQTLSGRFQHMAQPLLRQVPAFLSGSLLHAHHHIVRYAADKGMLDTPRTTLVAAVIERNRLHGIHCGDSRLYVVREGRALLRTRDHSMLERQKTVAGAPPGNRNMLFSCLGSSSAPLFDVSGPLELHSGDRILLCSDGLWSALSDQELVKGMSQGPLEDAVDRLVNEALRRSGAKADNVSALAVDWEAQDDFRATRVSTEALQDGVFASTLDANAAVQASDSVWDMDDETIERTIAEINDAIRKAAARKS
jgi:serine/threonine protein phosphatase PrpC